MRTITSTLKNAINQSGTYYPLANLRVYKSRMFFDALTADNAIPQADAIGVNDNPLAQDVIFHYSLTASGIFTFFSDEGVLKYAIDGDPVPVTTTYACTCKPGIFRSDIGAGIIFMYDGSYIKQYTIDFSAVVAKNPVCLTLTRTSACDAIVYAVHGVDYEDCVLIVNSYGGFRAEYLEAGVINTSTSRFVFSMQFDWDGSGRSMESLALFSSSFKFGNRVFVYMSNAAVGSIEGIFYDPSEGWSDVFVALETDKSVSLCEFRIANGFVESGYAYICGQFIRTDAYVASQPYTLILRSETGLKYSLDRFSLVSNIGYRFMAVTTTIGPGNYRKLILGNGNRICSGELRWPFGDDEATRYLSIPSTDIIDISEGNGANLEFTLSSADESYAAREELSEGNRVIFYAGMKTSEGDEYVEYGRYIINSINEYYADGKRSIKYSATQEGLWRMGGLTMPFYIELLGKSYEYNSLVESTNALYTATNPSITRNQFYVDFWSHEEYVNTDASITGISMIDANGVGIHTEADIHKVGIINNLPLKDIMSLTNNPKIIDSTLDVSIYGWCYTTLPAHVNDNIELVLVTCDEDGTNESVDITDLNLKWMRTYPAYTAGYNPITMSLSVTPGRYIKKVGIVFDNPSNGSTFGIARVEFNSGAQAAYEPNDLNTGWTQLDDGSMLLPREGRPYIMFSQKPYNALNFCITGSFENTITGNVSGYPVAIGLVGHAEDASNYTVGRYNSTNDKIELVVCRNGTEVVVDSIAMPWTLTSTQTMMFRHKDGVFQIYMYRNSTSRLELILEHQWESIDGFMYTSPSVSMKTGIYGYVNAPNARILGYTPYKTDTTINTDGLAFDAFSDTTDFPSSGRVQINNNVYEYTGKISMPDFVGPYQYRQANAYGLPYGNGQSGVEYYNFNWNGLATDYAGKMIAIDNGSNFVCSATLWRIFTRVSGEITYSMGRARAYSLNNQIAKTYGSLANKVWITGGLTGVSSITPYSGYESVGDLAVVKLDGSIICKWISSTGGYDDATIETLMDRVCAISGTKANFPGNSYIPVFTGDEGNHLKTDYYAEGFDITFNTSPDDLDVITNIKIDPTNYEESATISSDTGLTLRILSLGSGSFDVSILSTPSDTQMFRAELTTDDSAYYKVRILFSDKSISYYLNNKWQFTFAFDNLIYNQTDNVEIQMDPLAATITDIYISDLANVRDAVYIDMETDGMSAISSIFQERPIEIHPKSDGSIDFWYEDNSPTVTGTIDARSMQVKRSIPIEGVSDAIVYGSTNVVTIQNSDFGSTLGFSTKVMKMSNLNAGAIESTQKILNKIYENSNTIAINIRPELELEVSDLYEYSYTLSSTGTVKSGKIHVDQISFQISTQGNYVSSQMTIQGRMHNG